MSNNGVDELANGAVPAFSVDLVKMSLLEEENRKLKDQVERLKTMLRRQLNYDGGEDFEHLFWEENQHYASNTFASDEENRTCDSAGEDLDPYAAAASEEKRRLDETDDSSEESKDYRNSDERPVTRGKRSRCVSGLRLVPTFEYVAHSKAPFLFLL